jgi:hypothetical protein
MWLICHTKSVHGICPCCNNHYLVL